MIKFPSINQFRHVVKAVKSRAAYHSEELPTLQFLGTVKLHGTNSSIVFKQDGTIEYQSRNRVITPTDDNAGFASFMRDTGAYHDIHRWVTDYLGTRPEPITVYGEWCGGNIQKGVALSQLGKMFVIFGVRTGDDDNTQWHPLQYFDDLQVAGDVRVYTIDTFPTFTIDIDFSLPEESQNKMVTITEEVEKECPVGKALGVSGIGEGVVWKCTNPLYSSSDFMFKVKGDKHSVTKVKKLASVDPEKARSVKEFIDNTVTENRLKQGIDYLQENNIPVNEKATGDFIRWVFNDIMKEESDTLEVSGLERKDIGGAIANKARPWLFVYLDKQA